MTSWRNETQHSSSLLEVYSRCPRKWWWEHVAGFRPPETASQALGTELHAQLENYIKTGVPPENKRALEAAKKYLGRVPRAGLLSEREFEAPIHIPGRTFVGTVDVTDEEQDHILDFKSTSDLDRYAKTDYQLERNLQLNAYACHSLDRLKGDDIKISHLYIQTRGAIKSRLVSAVTTRAAITRRWGGYLKIIDNIELDRAKTNANDVEPNPSACRDYGGCPHLARCNALEFSGSFEVPELLNPPDTTRRQPGAVPATPLTVASENLPEVLAKEARKGVALMNPTDRLAAMGSSPAPVQTAPLGRTQAFLAQLGGAQQAGPPVDDIIEDDAGEEEGEDEASAVAPITPVQSAGPPSLAPGFVWAIGADGMPYQRRAEAPPVATIQAPSAVVPAPVVQVAPPAAEAPAEAPKRRGRPPKAAATQATLPDARAAVEVDDPAMGYVQPAMPSAAPVVTTPTPPAPSPTTEAGLMFLFVDCFPVHGFPGSAPRLGQWLEPVLTAIKERTGADWQFHEFRKGPAILNQFAQAVPLPSALIVDSRSPEASVLWEYLMGKARVIFQGAK